MTPDEARDLLDGTTPAEDWWYSVKGGWVRHLEPVGIDAAGELDVPEDDAALIVAAPALAAMIAGMRAEYMALNRADENGEWHQVTPWSAEWPFRTGHVPDPRFDKVIRRYVTTPEEA